MCKCLLNQKASSGDSGIRIYCLQLIQQHLISSTLTLKAEAVKQQLAILISPLILITARSISIVHRVE
jgi:hypothetical protein